MRINILLKTCALVAIVIGSAIGATAQTLTLDLATYSKPVNSGGYWTATYNEDSTTIGFGEFVFSHSAGWGGSYWDGITYANNGDSARYGIPCPVQPCDTTHSLPWLDHQWGVMAAGGILNPNANPPTVLKGNPYLVGYWGYYEKSQGNHSLEVKLADDSPFTPLEVYICNHPRPYWGNIYGDGFAGPLDQPNDHFDLWIHALDDSGYSMDSIKHVPAYFDSETNRLVQSPNWEKIDLTQKGWEDISGLAFTMYSTDQSPPYGPNTAVYFNPDRLKVEKNGRKKSSAPKARTLKTTPPSVEVKDYFPIKSYTGGPVTVHNNAGKEVYRTTLKAGEKVNLSKLPAGEYRLRHGHKNLPFKKVK